MRHLAETTRPSCLLLVSWYFWIYLTVYSLRWNQTLKWFLHYLSRKLHAKLQGVSCLAINKSHFLESGSTFSSDCGNARTGNRSDRPYAEWDKNSGVLFPRNFWGKILAYLAQSVKEKDLVKFSSSPGPLSLGVLALLLCHLPTARCHILSLPRMRHTMVTTKD